MDTEKQRQRRHNDARLTESGNTRSEQPYTLKSYAKRYNFLQALLYHQQQFAQSWRYGVTRKWMRQVATQRNSVFHGALMAHCSLFSRDKFVWLDQMGADARGHIRWYGYAIRRMRPVTHRFMSRDKRVNAIAALSQEGIDSSNDAIWWCQSKINPCNG